MVAEMCQAVSYSGSKLFNRHQGVLSDSKNKMVHLVSILNLDS